MVFIRYLNVGGNSGVIAYRVTENALEVLFRGNTGFFCLYSYKRSLINDALFSSMVNRAQMGEGLNQALSSSEIKGSGTYTKTIVPVSAIHIVDLVEDR